MSRIKVNIRNIFITGLLVLLPLGVTFYILLFMFEFFDGILRPVIQKAFGYYFPGTGIVAIILVIFLLGIFVRITIGRKIFGFIEEAIDRIPMIRTIYSVVKYASHTMLFQDGSEFKGVVLIEYPRKGVYTIGFTTGTIVREIQNLTEEKVINVFVPTSPNPTSGYVVQIPERDVVHMKMTVEEGVKLIISGGFLNQ